MINKTILVEPGEWITVANLEQRTYVEARVFSDVEHDPGMLELGIRLILDGFPDQYIGASIGDGPLQEIRLEPHSLAVVDIMASNVETQEEYVVRTKVEKVRADHLVQISHQFTEPLELQVEIYVK